MTHQATPHPVRGRYTLNRQTGWLGRLSATSRHQGLYGLWRCGVGLLFALAMSAAFAQQYVVDPSFDPGAGADGLIREMVRTPDGKILIGGDFLKFNGVSRIGIARLNSDGSLDANFNPTLITNGTPKVRRIAIQRDGAILIGGNHYDASGYCCNGFLVRINPDGTKDGGFSQVPHPPMAGWLQALKVQPDGKILAGFFSDIGETRGIERFMSDGTNDTNFYSGRHFQSVNHIDLDASGRVVIGGALGEMPRLTQHKGVLRLLASGAVDPTFNVNGVGLASCLNCADLAGLRADGNKILLGANGVPPTTYNGTEVGKSFRLREDGNLDTSFNNSAIQQGTVYSFDFQPDGKIIVGGTSMVSGAHTRNGVARLTSSGDFDVYFNPGAGANEAVHRALVMDNDKILIAGGFTTFDGVPRNRVARIMPRANFTVKTLASRATVAPAGPLPVARGDSASFTITPDQGYRITSVFGCPISSQSGSTYTVGPVTSDCQLEVQTWLIANDVQCGFAEGVPTHAAPSPAPRPTALCERGDIASLPTLVNVGAFQTAQVWQWTCGSSVTGIARCEAPYAPYVATPVAGPNGSISPDTPQPVGGGLSASFTITPATGYEIDAVTGCNGGFMAGKYTTGEVRSDCTVNATFRRIEPVVNGSCGAANGVSAMAAPNTGLCSTGTAGAIGGTGPWLWSCRGSGGGGTANCMAPAFVPVTHFEGTSATGSGTVTVDLSGGGQFCGFEGTPALIAAAPGANPATPAGITFPHGLFDFKTSHCTPGSTITLAMQFPATPPIAGATYYKWGPEPGNTMPHWYQMPASIAGSMVTFSITDGGQGDDDLAANGAIVDQGGPGLPTGTAGPGNVAAVPTLGEWTLMALGLLLAGLGAGGLARRRLH